MPHQNRRTHLMIPHFCAGLLAIGGAVAFTQAPARAQAAPPIPSDTKPITPPTAGNVKGAVAAAAVQPIGFSLVVLFYNDGSDSQIATAQNVQTEARLRQALVQTGAKPETIHAPLPRFVTAPTLVGSHGEILTAADGGTQKTSAVRVVRRLTVAVRGVNNLGPMVGALRSVGATGNIVISCDYGDKAAPPFWYTLPLSVPKTAIAITRAATAAPEKR